MIPVVWEQRKVQKEGGMVNFVRGEYVFASVYNLFLKVSTWYVRTYVIKLFIEVRMRATILAFVPTPQLAVSYRSARCKPDGSLASNTDCASEKWPASFQCPAGWSQQWAANGPYHIFSSGLPAEPSKIHTGDTLNSHSIIFMLCHSSGALCMSYTKTFGHVWQIPTCL